MEYQLILKYYSDTTQGVDYLRTVHLLWKSYCNQMVTKKKKRFIKIRYGNALTLFTSLKLDAYFFTLTEPILHQLLQDPFGIWQCNYLEKII